MSTNIPTRRVLRNNRLPNENAVKPTVRTKPPSTATVTGPSKALSGGTTSAPETIAHKRKREALGEVTNNNKDRNIPSDALPQGSKLKGAPITTIVPVRTVKPAAKLPAKKKDVVGKAPSDNAMVVDEPAPALRRVTRRATNSTAVTTTTVNQIRTIIDEIVEEEPEPALKKRRTSEADVEAVVEAPQEPVLDSETAQCDLETEAREDAVLTAADVEGWDDLDAEDIDDPIMVSEYVNDIFIYLRECEEQTLPDPEYMQHQKELRWSHRGILMDFLIGVHNRVRLLPETLYLAVNIIDRFLSLRVVSLSKVQLVGLSSLLIACKFEEICTPSVKDIMKIGGMDNASEEDMLKAERYILKTLNWSVSIYPQPMNWLRRISKADDYEATTRIVAKFFLEIHVVERRLLGVKPSLLAAASMWLGRLVLGRLVWTPNLIHYSGYLEEEILPVANIILNYCLRPEKHESLITKYSSKKYQKVAPFVNNWITSRWTMGEKILLQKELPYLIALAEAEKDEEN